MSNLRLLKIYLFILLLFFQLIVDGEPAISSFDMPARLQPAYKHPTERFSEFYNYERILQSLRENGMSLEHRNFFEHIIPHEELGFFGYHSSTQGFRIFQDIIRVVLEEICNIEIKKDFHFLRVPGSPLLSRQNAEQFLRDYSQINDHVSEQKEQLLSMNYTLFGNFNRFGECSVYYFTKNRSASSVVFQTKLQDLFQSVGLPTEAISALFSIGNPLIDTNNAVLFQFFDFSHYNAFQEIYHLVDQMCYTALPMGIPQPINTKMSDLYLGNHPQQFTAQFRLVINNSLILNPFSALSIKRYERSDPEIVKEYEAQLRAAIKKLPHDPVKAKRYRQLLLNLWGQMDED